MKGQEVGERRPLIDKEWWVISSKGAVEASREGALASSHM